MCIRDSFYGDEKHWEVFQKFAFEAALNSTDVVVQPRQSNTWGALSLDHVYEFMGGMNLAVRNVTGKDPVSYTHLDVYKRQITPSTIKTF